MAGPWQMGGIQTWSLELLSKEEKMRTDTHSSTVVYALVKDL